MLGFMQPSAETTFLDEFTSLSLRNTAPTGVNKVRNGDAYGAKLGTGLNNVYAPYDAAGRYFPENWGVGLGAGLSLDLTAIGSTTINGQTCRTVTYRLYGTTSGAADSYFVFETNGAVRAASGETWVFSLYMATAAGGTGLTNVTNVQLNMDFWTDADGYLSGGYNGGLGLTGTLTRYLDNSATAGATANYVKPSLQITCNGAVNLYFTVAAPQLEKASTPTNYILTSANTGTWNTRQPWGPNTIANSEQQYYPNIAEDGTRKSGGNNPFSVAGSILSITGAAAPGGSSNSQPYTSGVLTTYNGYQPLYGYFECRMKSPPGQGVWPSFWLYRLPMPNDNSITEIDIMEWPGTGISATTIYQTIHSGTTSAPIDTQFVPQMAANDMSANYHLYGVDWRSDKITFYIDRVMTGSLATAADLKSPMFVVVNLALGGTWPGNVVNTGQVPAVMLVDYVRVWDKLPF